jgi:hypothetical protein
VNGAFEKIWSKSQPNLKYYPPVFIALLGEDNKKSCRKSRRPCRDSYHKSTDTQKALPFEPTYSFLAILLVRSTVPITVVIMIILLIHYTIQTVREYAMKSQCNETKSHYLRYIDAFLNTFMLKYAFE